MAMDHGPAFSFTGGFLGLLITDFAVSAKLSKQKKLAQELAGITWDCGGNSLPDARFGLNTIRQTLQQR
jgi:hypothetical protein